MARKDPFEARIPNKRIPVVIAGEQKYIEPQDLVLTASERDALSQNRADVQHQRAVEEIAHAVYANAASFIVNTVAGAMPANVLADDAKMAAWMNENGIEAEQDGLTTVVRGKVDGNMRVLRTMTARVDERFEEDVAMWIRKEVKETKLQAGSNN